MKELLTVAQVGKLLGITPQAVYQMKHRGQLPFIQVARRGIRFDPDDIKTYIDNNRQQAEARK